MIINIAVSNDYGPSVRFKTVTFQQPALCFLFYHCPTFPTHVSKEIVSWMSGQAKLFWEQNIHLTTFIRHGLKIIWLRFVEDQTKCVWGLLLKLHQFCSSTIQSSVIQSTPLLLTLKHAIHYSEHIKFCVRNVTSHYAIMKWFNVTLQLKKWSFYVVLWCKYNGIPV